MTTDTIGRTFGDLLYTEPEDRSAATLSPQGTVEYVDDLVRPGRVVVVAAEEGTGKSFAITGELGLRMAVAGGAFAGTFEVREPGPVLVLSEMHADDDWMREEAILAALGRERADLAGRYFRLSVTTAANGDPALVSPSWRGYIAGWMADHDVRLLIVDTATRATRANPWGDELQVVYDGLAQLIAAHPPLAVILIVHLKKPPAGAGGARRITDVLGDWGKWADVVVLMENDGQSLDRVRLTTRKRVRRERRIVCRKAGGLLVDPVDVDRAGPSVPTEAVRAAIEANPGMTYADLARALGVSKDTATRYVKALGDEVDTSPTGPRGAVRLHLTAAPPQTAAHAHAVVDAANGDHDRRTAARTYISAADAAVVAGEDAVLAFGLLR